MLTHSEMMTRLKTEAHRQVKGGTMISTEKEGFILIPHWIKDLLVRHKIRTAVAEFSRNMIAAGRVISANCVWAGALAHGHGAACEAHPYNAGNTETLHASSVEFEQIETEALHVAGRHGVTSQAHYCPLRPSGEYHVWVLFKPPRS